MRDGLGYGPNTVIRRDRLLAGEKLTPESADDWFVAGSASRQKPPPAPRECVRRKPVGLPSTDRILRRHYSQDDRRKRERTQFERVAAKISGGGKLTSKDFRAFVEWLFQDLPRERRRVMRQGRVVMGDGSIVEERK